MWAWEERLQNCTEQSFVLLDNSIAGDVQVLDEILEELQVFLLLGIGEHFIGNQSRMKTTAWKRESNQWSLRNAVVITDRGQTRSELASPDFMGVLSQGFC